MTIQLPNERKQTIKESLSLICSQAINVLIRGVTKALGYMVSFHPDQLMMVMVIKMQICLWLTPPFLTYWWLHNIDKGCSHNYPLKIPSLMLPILVGLQPSEMSQARKRGFPFKVLITNVLELMQPILHQKIQKWCSRKTCQTYDS